MSDQSDMDLPNFLELRAIAKFGDADAKPQRLQTIQQYLKLPQA